jgi:hypothetical protein
MTIAELHNKQGEEDSLTADVFGGFKYLSPAAGLLPFLAKAELFQKGAQLPSWNAEAALYCFWPRAKRREPDLFILLLRGNRSPVAIVVEAKYHSGKHNLHSSVGEEPLSDPSEAVKDSDVQAVARTDGDQLADYFCALLEGDLRLDQWRKYEVVSGSARFSRKPTQPDQLLKSVLVNDKYLLYVTATTRYRGKTLTKLSIASPNARYRRSVTDSYCGAIGRMRHQLSESYSNINLRRSLRRNSTSP